MKFTVWTRRLPWGRITALVAAVVTVACICLIYLWDSLGLPEIDNLAIRNIIFAAAALIGLPLTIWRSRVAERQVEAAQQSLLNERYQKGAEMLGNQVLAVRLGGIYTLRNLAEEHPLQYHIQIMRLFCAFVRHPTKENELADKTNENLNQTEIKANESQENEKDKPTEVRPDVQAIMEAIGDRDGTIITLEKKNSFRLDFGGASLNGLGLYAAELSNTWFRETNLSGVKLNGANLTNALFFKTKLIGADLSETNLTETKFDEVDLSKVQIEGANLTSADLSKATGLTQKQLDLTRAHPNSPPDLGDAFDSETGGPLEWRE